MKTCPFCQKEIADDSVKCRYCNAWFTDDAEKKQKQMDQEKRMEKILQDKGKEEGQVFRDDTQYFYVPPRKMIIRSILSLGLYEIYWFFRNWKSVRDQEGLKISPFWRAIFSILFCYSLFKRILLTVKEKGFEAKNSYGSLTAAYIIILFLNRLPEPFDMLALLSFIPLLAVNQAILFQNTSLDPVYQPPQKMTGGERTLIIVGILMWGLLILGYLVPTASPV